MLFRMPTCGCSSTFTLQEKELKKRAILFHFKHESKTTKGKKSYIRAAHSFGVSYRTPSSLSRIGKLDLQSTVTKYLSQSKHAKCSPIKSHFLAVCKIEKLIGLNKISIQINEYIVKTPGSRNFRSQINPTKLHTLPHHHKINTDKLAQSLTFHSSFAYETRTFSWTKTSSRTPITSSHSKTLTASREKTTLPSSERTRKPSESRRSCGMHSDNHCGPHKQNIRSAKPEYEADSDRRSRKNAQ